MQCQKVQQLMASIPSEIASMKSDSNRVKASLEAQAMVVNKIDAGFEALSRRAERSEDKLGVLSLQYKSTQAMAEHDHQLVASGQMDARLDSLMRRVERAEDKVNDLSGHYQQVVAVTKEIAGVMNE